MKLESNTANKAERELNILEKTSPDSLVLEFKDEILALVEKFGLSGQSGGSAPYVAGAISDAVKKLCMQESIAPITGEDSEWVDISSYGPAGDLSYQNNRCVSLFKNGKDGESYYIDAIIFKGQNGSCFTGSSVKLKSGESIASRQFIKSFPFTPKRFYVDVIETEWADKNETIQKSGGGWWTSIVKDESQLKEVWDYYKCTNKDYILDKKLEELDA